jgi:quinol-cytochrome oxidoreductase complex cytochrome b subunit
MLLAILILILIPLVLNQLIETNFMPTSGAFRPCYELLIQIFFVSCIILGWIGGNPAISPYIEIALIVC